MIKEIEYNPYRYDKLPPHEILEYSKEINQILALFKKQSHTSNNAFALLEKARLPLVSIKEIIGKNHNYYLDISSRLGNEALNYIIDDVNSASENPYKNTASSSLSEFVKSVSRNSKITYEIALENALRAMTIINLLDKTVEFSKRFLSIKNKIDLLVFQYENETKKRKNFNTSKIDNRFFYGDQEFFNSCYSKEDLEAYLDLFPHGKHVIEVKAKIKTITEQHDDWKFRSCSTRKQYIEYLSLFPNGKHVKEAKEIIKNSAAQEIREDDDDYMFNHSYYKEDFDEYIRCFPNGKHIEEAKMKIHEYFQNEEDIFNSCRFIKDYRNYLESYPTGRFVEESIIKIEKKYQILRRTILIVLIVLFVIIASSYIFIACS